MNTPTLIDLKETTQETRGGVIKSENWNNNFARIRSALNSNNESIKQFFASIIASNIPSEPNPDLGETDIETSDIATQILLITSMLLKKADSNETLSALNTCVKNIEFNSDNGVFTIIHYDDSKTEIDTILEKVPATFALRYDEESKNAYLGVTNADGSYSETDITKLIDTYTFIDGKTIDFTVDSYVVTADIKDGCITLQKLSPETIEYLNGLEISALDSSARAKTSEINAKQSEENAAASSRAAKTSEANAQVYATDAYNSSIESRSSASSASNSASTAVSSANDANRYKNLAKEYMELAKEASGGDYVTRTEINTALGNKSDTTHNHDTTYSKLGHKHSKSDITDFPTSMPASDVKAWAKANNKPTYTWSEIGSKPSTFTPSEHVHNIATREKDGFMSASDKVSLDSVVSSSTPFKDCNTAFNSDGSISQSFNNGTITTTFNNDGSITEVYRYTDGSVLTKTTIFNTDGSISEVVS